MWEIVKNRFKRLDVTGLTRNKCKTHIENFSFVNVKLKDGRQWLGVTKKCCTYGYFMISKVTSWLIKIIMFKHFQRTYQKYHDVQTPLVDKWIYCHNSLFVHTHSQKSRGACIYIY